MAEKQFNIIDKDKSLDELCKNSIDLVEYARGITAKQINIIQLMTFYSIGSILVICQELFEKDFDMFFGKKGNFNRPSVCFTQN